MPSALVPGLCQTGILYKLIIDILFIEDIHILQFKPSKTSQSDLQVKIQIQFKTFF